MLFAPNGVTKRGNTILSTKARWCSYTPSSSRSSCTEIRPIGGVRSMPSERLVVAAQLDDEHPAVAVERDLSRLLDVGVGEHGREVIAGRKPEAPGLFGRGKRNDRGLRREIGVGVCWIIGGRGLEDSAAAAPPGATRIPGRCAPAGGAAAGVCASPCARVAPLRAPRASQTTAPAPAAMSHRRRAEDTMNTGSSRLSGMFSTTEITEKTEKHQCLFVSVTPLLLWCIPLISRRRPAGATRSAGQRPSSNRSCTRCHRPCRIRWSRPT